jgi:hypothetical protein
MSWVRLESAFFSHPQTLAVGFWGSQVFLAALTMSKLHNWRVCIPKAHFASDTIAHHLNLVTDRNAAKQLRDGIALCVKHGLLVDDTTHYVIPSWGKYQPDPTNSQRQEKFRATSKVRRAKKKVTGSNGYDRNHASVTARVLPSEEQGTPSALPGAGAAFPSAGEEPRSYADRLASVRKRALTDSPENVQRFAAILQVRWPE